MDASVGLVPPPVLLEPSADGEKEQIDVSFGLIEEMIKSTYLEAGSELVLYPAPPTTTSDAEAPDAGSS